jgi:hypothetical protein
MKKSMPYYKVYYISRDGIKKKKEIYCESPNKIGNMINGSIVKFRELPDCDGCRYDHPGQEAHMGPGGCLEC